MLIQIKQITDIAHRISHSVTTFTLNMRPGSLTTLILILPLYTYILYMVIIGIHRTGYITPLTIALVMSQTSIIQALNRLFHRFEICTVSGFIAIGPHKNRDMIP